MTATELARLILRCAKQVVALFEQALAKDNNTTDKQ